MTMQEGVFPAIITGASFGKDAKGTPNVVQITARITDGPDAGKLVTYEDAVNTKSAKYIAWSAKAVGWKAVNLESLAADVDAWIAKTGGKSTVEIKNIPFTDKKTNEPRIWSKCNAIGKGLSQPLTAPSSSDLKDANDAMREFIGDDAPRAGGAGGVDDLPFVSCALEHDVDPIAEVLR